MISLTKFRGKSIKNGEWIFGYLAELSNKIFHTTYVYKVIFKDMSIFNTDNFWHVVKDCQVDEKTIGVFTGLYDYNGKEIFHGDILRSKESYDIMHYITYDNKEASFVAISIDKTINTEVENRCTINQYWIDEFSKEVIGNVYENENLLLNDEI